MNKNYKIINVNRKLFLKFCNILKTNEIFLYDKHKRFRSYTISDFNDSRELIIPLGFYSNPDLYFPYSINFKYNTINSNIESNIELRENQKQYVKKFYTVCKEISEKNVPIAITLNLPCGFGKTIIATYLISRLKYKTIIICNRLSLIKQWENVLLSNLKNINIVASYKGVNYFMNKFKIKNSYIEEKYTEDITNFKEEIERYENINISKEDIDILLIPDRHLSNNDFNYFISKNFSVCITDESHRFNSQNNSSYTYFMSHYTFPYLFSLTATVREENKLFFGYTLSLEKDQLEKLEEEKNLNKTLYIVNTRIPLQEKQDTEKIRNLKNEITKYKNSSYIKKNFNIALLRKKILIFDEMRFKVICNNILNNFNSNSRVLVLTYLIEEMNNIYNYINKNINTEVEYFDDDHKCVKDNNTDNNIVFKGNVKNNLELTFNNVKLLKKFILIATCQSSGTGIDIPSLNILHITFPIQNISSIEQFCGRIERNYRDKNRKIFIYNCTSIKQEQDNLTEKNKIIETFCKFNGWNIEDKLIMN